MIKRSLRGLAADFYKTQKIVLANSAKVRVGSEKKIRDGPRLKRPNRSRGLLIKFTRHMN